MERPTLHRVFEGGSPIRLSGPNVFQATDVNSAYRLTGLPQIKDIIESGAVRAKEGKIKGGRIGEVHWSAGHPRLAYSSSPASESYVLQSSIQNLRGRQAGLPASEARVWHSPVGTTEWKDITSQIRQQAGATRQIVAREAGRDLMPAARTLGRALGTEAASLGGMALRGALRFAGPAGAVMTAYDAATMGPAILRDFAYGPWQSKYTEPEMKEILRQYRTSGPPATVTLNRQTFPSDFAAGLNPVSKTSYYTPTFPSDFDARFNTVPKTSYYSPKFSTGQ